jgi:hypothetical protein
MELCLKSLDLLLIFSHGDIKRFSLKRRAFSAATGINLVLIDPGSNLQVECDKTIFLSDEMD